MWSIRDLKMKGYKKSRSKKGDKYIVYKCDLQERMSVNIISKHWIWGWEK